MVDGVEIAGWCGKSLLEISTAKAGTKETGFSCRLEGSSAKAGTEAAKKSGSEAD